MQNKQTNITEKYKDIIHLPHHVSANRPQMTIIDRAAQFSPFAALTGYDAAIAETERLTQEFVDLDESRKAVLNGKLQWLLEHEKKHPEITITYFQPDRKKEGGKYIEVTGRVKKINGYEGCIILNEDIKISIENIYELEIL